VNVRHRRVDLGSYSTAPVSGPRELVAVGEVMAGKGVFAGPWATAPMLAAVGPLLHAPVAALLKGLVERGRVRPRQSLAIEPAILMGSMLDVAGHQGPRIYLAGEDSADFVRTRGEGMLDVGVGGLVTMDAAWGNSEATIDITLSGCWPELES
jgi:hypothetical protein